MLFQKKYLIGQEMVRRGLISQDNLDVALIEHERSGDRLGRILVQCGFITDDDLLGVLSDQLGLPVFKIREIEVPAAVIEKVPANIARQYKIVPVSTDDEKITICMSDPLSKKEIDEIAAHLKKPVAIVIDSDKQVLFALKKYYGVTDKDDLDIIEDDQSGM
jgi:type IV pilus assembly protein PilB